jgi:tetratricopeptide (TPR) repeat protein
MNRHQYSFSKPQNRSLSRRPSRVIEDILRTALRHHQSGRLSEAALSYRRILAIDAHHTDSLNLLGLIAGQSGRHDIAVELIGQAIRLRNNNPFYLFNMGNALKAEGRIDEAVAHYERALVLKPDLADAHNNLGIVFAAQDRIDDAIAHYKRAIAVKPDHASAHSNLGFALLAQGKLDDASAHYEKALAIDPDHAEAHNNIGNILKEQGKFDGAMVHYERAIAITPDRPEAHYNLGVTLVAQGRINEAVPHYERALALKPDYANAHNNLGFTLDKQGRPDDAVAHYERALAINPDHAEAHNNLGNIRKDQGRFEDAMAHYGRAIAISPDYAEIHYNRSEIKTFHRGDADLAALESLAERHDFSANQAAHIEFALAKALEDSGDCARAFEHLRKGNALKRRQIDYDEQSAFKRFQTIPTVFDSSLLERFRRHGDLSSAPIFVLGMPRSGSTLIEQILASHPQIHGAGELNDLESAACGELNAADRPVPFPEYIAATEGAILRRIGQAYLSRLPVPAAGKVRIVDKLPGNFLNIGLIRLILPNARIIHTVRNPIDTCLSCYSKLFTSGQHFSYDLAELGRYYRGYSELMTYWRSVLPADAMLDVSYEDVVDDLEGQARRLIDYCGLPWDDRCLSFDKTNRTVRTASAVQVRKPLFRDSLQRWRKYEAELTPLLQELGDIISGTADARRSE